MSSIQSPASWYWRGDDDWVSYSPSLNKIIEEEYLKGNKKIKIDDERYIDLTCTVCLIILIFIYIILMVYSSYRKQI